MPPRHPIHALADRFVDEYAQLRPLDATLLGIGGHDDRWGELGPDLVAADAALLRDTRARLAALPAPDGRDDELAIATLRDLLDEGIEAHEHGDPWRDISHVASTIPSLRDALEAQDAATPEGRTAALRRLESLPDALDGWGERMRAAMDRDLLVPARQVRSVIDQLRRAVEEQGTYPELARSLIADDPGLTDPVRAALAGVRLASERTARFLEDVYLPRAPLEDAVGRERYLRYARSHLGASLDPETEYAWGWQELRALLDRARRVAATIDPAGTLSDVLERLRTDPAYAAATPDRFRALMQERLATALDALDGTYVHVPPEIREVEVRIAPAGGAIGAYYVGPSEDLRRPGSVWWSLGEGERVPLYEEVSTAYHEGFPGHHLQIGTQVLLSDRLTRAQRLLTWYSGYGEGWALYAETLMDELGMLDEPQYELGYLTGSILRALRVVIDLGLHLDLPIPDDAPFHAGRRWQPDLAVDVLHRVAGLPVDYAVSEVTRYLGWPAQAISYALGQRAILELREQRRRRDGAGFDLRTFHGDVLGSGPVGLDRLREVVLP